MIRRLNGHEYANAFVVIDDNGDIRFISYNTTVAVVKVDDETGFRWLYVNGLYSMTTRKHLGWFMKEYFNMTYQDAKKIYENNWWYCLNTGEVVFNS